MLVFGHYGFPIKTIKPGADHPEVDSIQLIVRVFHFFYIPLFPYTKIWTVNKNGQRYRIEGSSALECQRIYGNPGYPFYAFAGIFLIALIPLGFSMKGMIQNAQLQQEAVEQKIKVQEEFLSQTKKLGSGDILIFTNQAGKYLYTKIADIDEEKVTVKVPDAIVNIPFENEKAIIEYLQMSTHFRKIDLSKSILINIFQPEAFDLEAKSEISFLNFSNLKLREIVSISNDF